MTALDNARERAASLAVIWAKEWQPPDPRAELHKAYLSLVDEVTSAASEARKER